MGLRTFDCASCHRLALTAEESQAAGLRSCDDDEITVMCAEALRTFGHQDLSVIGGRWVTAR